MVASQLFASFFARISYNRREVYISELFRNKHLSVSVFVMQLSIYLRYWMEIMPSGVSSSNTAFLQTNRLHCKRLTVNLCIKVSLANEVKMCGLFTAFKHFN